MRQIWSTVSCLPLEFTSRNEMSYVGLFMEGSM